MHFSEVFKQAIQALLADSISFSGREVWCPWSSENTTILGFENTGLSGSSYQTIFPGLKKLGVIDKVDVASTPHWNEYSRREWKRNRSGGSRKVYEILDRKRLEVFEKDPPAETHPEWSAFVLTGKRSRASARVPSSTHYVPPVLEATRVLLESVDCDKNPIRSLSQALFRLSAKLNKLTADATKH